MGPASDAPDMLEKMAKAGMNLVRLNFSHGNYVEHKVRIDIINEMNKKLNTHIATVLDTQGPEIRLGTFAKKEMLIDGQEVLLTTEDVVCTDKVIAISYKKICKSVVPGDFIYFADGTIELKVKQVFDKDVLCTVIVGGEVNTKKNVGIPNVEVDLPSISQKDKEDIKFGAENKVDFIAQSFVKCAQDVLDMRKLLDDNSSDALIIAKIECPQAMKNLDEIIAVSDAVMVARGDLGVQIPIEQVPNAQKLIIKKCQEACKPVIVATQMLESMTKNPRPTRAEVTDVANAIFDGADAIMLSGETAGGKYPLRAIEMMTKIAKQTESRMDFNGLKTLTCISSISNAISRSVCLAAHEVKAAAIVTCTMSGHTAKTISCNRPGTRIIALTPNERDIRKLNLWWSVIPILIETPETMDDLIKHGVHTILKEKLVEKGDTVVFTAGIPFTTPGNMNMMKIHLVE